MKQLISSRNIKVVLAIVLAITCINGIGLNLNDHPIQVPDGTSSSQSKTTSTSSIPDYTGLASVVLSDGSGLDISDLPSETVLSELDSLGRCGTVEMVVTPDTMPAVGERRGSIGMVKPSGWRTVRDDSLDGKYLYNRCHLIAWSLSGMNAEERNLITGTRYMNVEGMLPYETQVASYIERTGNSVLYKVTPDFRDNELVARGVRIQAQSVDGQDDRFLLRPHQGFGPSRQIRKRSVHLSGYQIGKCSGWIKTRSVHTYGFCWQRIWYRKEVLDGL